MTARKSGRLKIMPAASGAAETGRSHGSRILLDECVGQHSSNRAMGCLSVYATMSFPTSLEVPVLGGCTGFVRAGCRFVLQVPAAARVVHTIVSALVGPGRVSGPGACGGRVHGLAVLVVAAAPGKVRGRIRGAWPAGHLGACLEHLRHRGDGVGLCLIALDRVDLRREAGAVHRQADNDLRSGTLFDRVCGSRCCCTA